MEQMKDMHVELRRLEDVIDSIEKKLHNTAGLLELIRSGMERLNGQASDLHVGFPRARDRTF